MAVEAADDDGLGRGPHYLEEADVRLPIAPPQNKNITRLNLREYVHFASNCGRLIRFWLVMWRIGLFHRKCCILIEVKDAIVHAVLARRPEIRVQGHPSSPPIDP